MSRREIWGDEKGPSSILKLAEKLFFGADALAAMGPDLVILKGKDGETGGKNRPEVFWQNLCVIIKGIKTGQITEMRPATVGICPLHHPGQDQDQSGKTVDDQSNTDQRYRGSSAKHGTGAIWNRWQKLEILLSTAADKDKQGHPP